MSEAWKIRYRELRAGLRCVRCGKQDALTLIGKCRCYECAEAENRDRRENRDYARIYAERKAKNRGTCIDCGAPAEDGHVRCGRCRRKHHWRYVRRKAKQFHPENWPRGDNGICWTCNREPILAGYRLCPECYQRISDQNRRTAEKRKLNYAMADRTTEGSAGEVEADAGAGRRDPDPVRGRE